MGSTALLGRAASLLAPMANVSLSFVRTRPAAEPVSYGKPLESPSVLFLRGKEVLRVLNFQQTK